MALDDWWFPSKSGPCWVCGDETPWAYLDLGWQHPNCDAYPDEHGNHIKIVRGVLVKEER